MLPERGQHAGEVVDVGVGVERGEADGERTTSLKNTHVYQQGVLGCEGGDQGVREEALLHRRGVDAADDEGKPRDAVDGGHAVTGGLAGDADEVDTAEAA